MAVHIGANSGVAEAGGADSVGVAAGAAVSVGFAFGVGVAISVCCGFDMKGKLQAEMIKLI